MRVGRKEIASMMTDALGFEISTDVVRKNADRWGIDEPGVRFDINARVVRYDVKKVIKALRRAKIFDGKAAASAASAFR